MVCSVLLFSIQIIKICCIDFQFVLTDGDERPTPQNSIPITAGDDFGRGSLVYFNQATMYQSSETGFDTVAQAKAWGHSGRTDYPKDIQEAFSQLAHFQPVPEDIREQLSSTLESENNAYNI